ncbi:MAG TPA: 2-dehydropantoate 2-reductase [Parvularculaceae bacterium]|nr:2-dehydropantoate 2-reductase [Parvularculaceae bacterium]
MKLLVFGAGAVGGYFGGRMAAAGLDITFVARGDRARKLRKDGLTIRSPDGEMRADDLDIRIAGEALPAADILLLAIKAKGLDEAIASLKGTIDKGTLIAPLLNGLRHIDALVEAFGEERVAGGVSYIQGSVDEDGAVRRHNEIHKLAVGARRDSQAPVLKEFVDYVRPAGFAVEYAADIDQAMWNKVTFLATLAAATCLARGAVGEIIAAPFGEDTMRGLFDECLKVAEAEGHALPAAAIGVGEQMLFAKGSGLSSSMFGDIRAGRTTEADHIIGDLVRRAAQRGVATPLLKAAHTAVSVYESRLPR